MAENNNIFKQPKKRKGTSRHSRDRREPMYVPMNPRDPLGLENPEAAFRPEVIFKKIYPQRRRSKSNSRTVQRGDLETNPSKFPFGNSPYFYHNRNPGGCPDNRMAVLERAWFEGKSVLDVGCNDGSFALSVASQFQPRRIVGVDIDPKLISSAWKNIKKYKNDKPDMVTRFFPANVEFRWENYAAETAEVLPAKYDCILALSVIKWIHLGFGDDALRRTFKRFFAELKPAGLLFLEYQTLHYYRKRKNSSSQTRFNFVNLRFHPIAFEDYLKCYSVGFRWFRTLQPRRHPLRGFRRRFIVLQKPASFD